MISQKYKDLIKKLSERTASKVVTWQKSSSQGEFKLQLSIGALTINKHDGDYNNSPSVWINLYNDRGDKIDNIDVEAGQEMFSECDELYNLVRRAYYKVDETIEGFFKALDSDNAIGIPDINNAPDDDDLPF